MQRRRGTREESVRRSRGRSSTTGARRNRGSNYARGERESNGGPQFDDGREGSRRPGLARKVGSALEEKLGGMDIDKALVLLHTALAIAIVIKQTRDHGPRRRAEPFRSALGVLNYYLNEGRDLSESQRAALRDIKEELRMLYHEADEEMMSPSR
jgi:hypothetical protein